MSLASDITDEATRPDRAPARSIHVTPAIARRLHGELAVVIDEDMPRSPGFEIVREAP